MCYHLASKSKKEELEFLFDAEFPESYENEYYHVSGFSHPFISVIRSDKQNIIQLSSWGLIPAWAKDEKQAAEMRAMTLNAKAETVFEKPSFRNSIKKNRCLVLVDGFYEWRHVGMNKFPYFIKLRTQEPFALGGIYNDWVNKNTGEIMSTFSIVTTDANSLMAEIHNSKKRMPLIIERNKEKDWVNPDLPEPEIEALMKPFDDREMEAYTVSKLVSRKDLNTNIPEALQPFEYPELQLLA